MAEWEQTITQELNALENCCVRFDTGQELTSAQKSTAKTNIGIDLANASNVSGDDYKIVFN